MFGPLGSDEGPLLLSAPSSVATLERPVRASVPLLNLERETGRRPMLDWRPPFWEEEGGSMAEDDRL